jgi:hypothetical protein
VDVAVTPTVGLLQVMVNEAGVSVMEGIAPLATTFTVAVAVQPLVVLVSLSV